MTSFLKDDRSRPVGIWLFATALLVLAMVVIGGATRLTDSGLSITEWRPITGVLPPLSDAAWAAEFAKYKAIPQFSLVNPHMTTAEFKGIFWWEWTHRLLGRLIGLVFGLPFVVFLVRREIPRRLLWRCLGLFVLGGLQGAVGWWMVTSGLEHNVSVAPERLMIHLGLALVLFCSLIWCGLEAWCGYKRIDAYGPWAKGGLAITGLIFFQAMLGALVAGNRAGKVYNDWPLMNGHLFPQDYVGAGFWATLAHSQAAVQFHHRMVGYLIFFLLLAFAWRARHSRFIQKPVRKGAYVLAGLGVFQVALGITTLMLVAPLSLSILHQTTAVLLLAVSTWVTWRARRV